MRIISCSEAKVHFSGVSDFGIEDIDRGIQTEESEADDER